MSVPDIDPEDYVLQKNGFSVLTETEEMEIVPRTEPTAVEKRVKVPPIVVTGVTDLASFKKQLTNHKDTCNLKVSFSVGLRGEYRVLTDKIIKLFSGI